MRLHMLLLATLTLGCNPNFDETAKDTLDSNGNGSSSSDDGDDGGDGDGDDGDESEEDSTEDELDDVDDDDDGYSEADGDCDDEDEDVSPDAIEICDGIDNDCDDEVDNEAEDGLVWYEDWDADGYGDPDVSEVSCDELSGYVEDNTDCNDVDEDAYPGADEIDWDGTDQDCDGYDFDADTCVETSAKNAMDWIAYWSYSVSDVSGEALYGLMEYELTNQVVWVEVDDITIKPGEDLYYELLIDTDLYMIGDLEGTWECGMEVGAVPVQFMGWLELDVDGEWVLAESGLTAELGATPSDTAWFSDCELSILDLIADYYDFDLLGFVDDTVTDVADALAEEIEYEIEFQVGWECSAW